MSEDDEEFMRRLDELAVRHDRAIAEQLEQTLADTPSTGAVPMPGEVHPAYQGHRFVLDWINGLHLSDRNELFLPHPRSLASFAAFTEPDAMYPTEPMPAPVVLTRRRCAGPAPYVGRPFWYVWDVAVDPWSRYAASEARIEYP